MESHWPRWGKTLYVVATLALFGAMMVAAWVWFARPLGEGFGHWYAEATAGWPYPAQIGVLAMIPIALYGLAYLAYRRDHRSGLIHSPTFWRYVRTGR
jgi:hypothetical protein